MLSVPDEQGEAIPRGSSSPVTGSTGLRQTGSPFWVCAVTSSHHWRAKANPVGKSWPMSFVRTVTATVRVRASTCSTSGVSVTAAEMRRSRAASTSVRASSPTPSPS